MAKRWVGSLELTVDDDTGALLVQSVSGGGSAGPVANELGPIAPGNPLDVWVRNDSSGRLEVMLFDSYGNYLGSNGDALRTSVFDGNGNPIGSVSGALLVAVTDTYGGPLSSTGGSLFAATFDANGNPIYSAGNALYSALYDASGNPLYSTGGALYLALHDASGNAVYSSNGAIYAAVRGGSGEFINSSNSALWTALFDGNGNTLYSTNGALYSALHDGSGNPIYSSGGALYTTLFDNSGQQIAGESNEFGQRGLSVSPLLQVTGSEGNLASASVLNAGDVTGNFALEGGTLTVLGNASAATTITLLLSADGSNFYAAETRTLAAASDFTFYLFTAARYCRLRTSAAVTLTATALTRR